MSRRRARHAPPKKKPEPPAPLPEDPRILLAGRVSLGLVFVGLVVMSLHTLVGFDVWWQIKTGEWVMTHGFPHTDPFSYAFPDGPWIELRWLYCVVAWSVFQSLGLNALIVIKIGVLLGTFAALALAAEKKAAWATALGLALFLVAGHQRFLVRPETVSFLALAVTLLCLERYRNGGRTAWIWALPAIQVLWCNTHTLWILGPVVQWIFVLGELMQGRFTWTLGLDSTGVAPPAGERWKKLAWVAGLSSLASLFTPYFFRGAMFPFQLFAQINEGHALNELISEFQSPLAHFSWSYMTVGWLVVTILSAGSFFLRRDLSWSRLGLWTAFFFLSVLAIRNIALFGLVAAFVTMRNLGERRSDPATPRRRPSLAPWAIAATSLFVVVMIPLVVSNRLYRDLVWVERFGFGLARDRYPIAAMTFVREEGLPTPVFNTLRDGGYVLFEGGERSTYADGRLEVYGGEALQEAIPFTQHGTDFDTAMRRFGVRTALIPNEERFTGLHLTLERDEDWVPVYFDASHVVYLYKLAETANLAARLGFTWDSPRERTIRVRPELDPGRFLSRLWPGAHRDAFHEERLGRLFLLVGQAERATVHLEAAIARQPSSPRTRLYLALAYRMLGRADEAAEQFALVPQDKVDAKLVEAFTAAPPPTSEATGLAGLRQAAEAAPQDPLGWKNLGETAFRQADMNTAADALRRYLGLQPDDWRSWNNLGVVSIRKGQAEEAAACFEESLRIQPGQASILDELGILHARRGDKEAARASFEEALRIDPTHEAAGRHLRLLEKM